MSERRIAGLDRWLAAALGCVAAAPRAAAQLTPFHRPMAAEEGADDDGSEFEWGLLDLFDVQAELGRSGEAVVRAGGRFALDATRYDRRNAKSNGLSNPIVRPIVEGRAFDTWFRFEFDAVGVDSKRHAFDLWAARQFGDAVNVQVGQVRVAMASEYATREENSPLIGAAFTSYLTGRYDLGARVEAGFRGDSVGLEAAAVAGHGFGLEGEGKGDPLLLARGTFQPFRASGAAALRGLYLGAAAAWQPDYSDEILVTTPLESVVFTTADLDGDRALWGAIEAGWFCGPFRIAYEGTRGIVENVEVPGGGSADIDQLFAWTATASLFLTGEHPQWRRGRWMATPRSAESMPLELAARYSNADLDRQLFDRGLTTYNPSTQEVRTFSLGLAWYPEAGTRVALQWVKTIADHELDTFGFDNRDSSFVLRLEVDL